MSANDMDALSGRAGQLIGAITEAILSTCEAAAERIQLASQVAQIQTRMAAFGAVLESVGAQKAALAGRLRDAPPAVAALLAAQVEALSAQELAILRKVGVPDAAAENAVRAIEAPAATHKREGRAFKRVELNGTH